MNPQPHARGVLSPRTPASVELAGNPAEVLLEAIDDRDDEIEALRVELTQVREALREIEKRARLASPRSYPRYVDRIREIARAALQEQPDDKGERDG